MANTYALRHEGRPTTLHGDDACYAGEFESIWASADFHAAEEIEKKLRGWDSHPGMRETDAYRDAIIEKGRLVLSAKTNFYIAQCVGYEEAPRMNARKSKVKRAFVCIDRGKPYFYFVVVQCEGGHWMQSLNLRTYVNARTAIRAAVEMGVPAFWIEDEEPVEAKPAKGVTGWDAVEEVEVVR